MNITTTQEAYEAFDGHIRDCSNEVVTVMGLEYDAANAFRELDPIAYRTYFNDYMDGIGVDTDELEGDFYR